MTDTDRLRQAADHLTTGTQTCWGWSEDQAAAGLLRSLAAHMDQGWLRPGQGPAVFAVKLADAILGGTDGS